MVRMSFRFIFASVILIFLSCDKSQRSPITQDSVKDRSLILISLDGFRRDYLDSFPTPTFQKIKAEGVSSQGLLPCFPSKTFPNHYSIVTGLYPEHHGIVGNTMYDQAKDLWFRIGSGSSPTRDAYWFEGEPIWVTAEKQNRKTATFYWPGSDAPIMGVMPTYHRYYDGSTAYTSRVDQVLEWLSLPERDRPGLLSLYFESPDREGHTYGPFAFETRKAVETVDSLVGTLIAGIEALNMTDKVNIMITSDHGMSQLSRDRVIFLDDYIDLESITLINRTPNAEILCSDSQRNEVFQALDSAHPKWDVYYREETPEHWNFRNHPRIAPIIVAAHDGWTITTREVFESHPSNYVGGAHGYDPQYESMHGIFLAMGPDFKEKVELEALENIHLYNLMCQLLKIDPAPNDGDPEKVIKVLKIRS